MSIVRFGGLLPPSLTPTSDPSPRLCALACSMIKLVHIVNKPFPTEPDEFDIKFDAQGVGIFVMRCPGNPKKICAVGVNRGPANQELRLHGWDGNIEAPTITPSIGCDNAPRCGFHGHIVAGVRTSST